MANKKKPVQEIKGYQVYTQYILVGAAIGLYYGLFSRTTQTSPDYVMVVILSIFAGLLTTVVRNWKKKKTFAESVLDFLKITGMFFVFLLALQIKPTIERLGGRTLAIVFMTVLGIGFGLVMGVRRKPAHS